MSRILSGTPVPRHQVFVLDDGDPVVQWSESRVQEIYSGRVRAFDYSQFGHPVTDQELNNLKSLGLVEHYTRQYVWVYSLPEQSRFIGLRTIEGSAGHSRVFYLNTTLPESELDTVVAALEAEDACETFTACAHEGIIAVFGCDWAAYASIAEAESAQRALTTLSPLFQNTVVAFVETPYSHHVVEQDEALDLNTLIASQSPTPVTAGKWAVLVSASADERQQIAEALHVLHMDVQSVESGGEALYLLEECAANDLSPALLMMDVRLSDMHGWEMLSRLREIPTLHTLPIIALADDAGDISDDDPTMALVVAGVQVYLSRPLNFALLRQRVYELLKEKC
jgi:CheY-like chemotaxis protein